MSILQGFVDRLSTLVSMRCKANTSSSVNARCVADGEAKVGNQQNTQAYRRCHLRVWFSLSGSPSIANDRCTQPKHCNSTLSALLGSRAKRAA
jgi:hypothetical protein